MSVLSLRPVSPASGPHLWTNPSLSERTDMQRSAFLEPSKGQTMSQNVTLLAMISAARSRRARVEALASKETSRIGRPRTQDVGCIDRSRTQQSTTNHSCGGQIPGGALYSSGQTLKKGPKTCHFVPLLGAQV